MRLDARLRRLEKTARVSDKAILARRDCQAIRVFLFAPPEGSVAALQAIGHSPVRDYFLAAALEMDQGTTPAT